MPTMTARQWLQSDPEILHVLARRVEEQYLRRLSVSLGAESHPMRGLMRGPMRNGRGEAAPAPRPRTPRTPWRTYP